MKRLILKQSLKGRRYTQRGKTGRDRLKRVLKTLSVAMYAKLINLATSKRRQKQLTTRNLRLKFLRRGRKSYTISTKISLITEERERGILNFWHEVSPCRFRLKVYEACRDNIAYDTTKTYDKVIIEARKFKRIRLFPWRRELDFGLEEECFKEMDARGIPHDPYLPYYDNPGKYFDKLPLTKIIGNNNLRQTKIDEYFRPVKDAKKLND